MNIVKNFQTYILLLFYIKYKKIIKNSNSVFIEYQSIHHVKMQR